MLRRIRTATNTSDSHSSDCCLLLRSGQLATCWLSFAVQLLKQTNIVCIIGIICALLLTEDLHA